MELDVLFIPPSEVRNKYLDSTVVVIIDVLRSGTSIAAALFNNAKEVIPVASLEKAAEVYHKLERNSRFIAGERNSKKPVSFDAGNSPEEFSGEAVRGKSIVLTTTNGTRALINLNKPKEILIGGFANFNKITGFLKDKFSSGNKFSKIIFVCSGSDGRFSYEDTLCAGAFVNDLKELDDIKLSDQAHAAMSLFNLFSDDLIGFIKNTEHAKRLISLELEKDIDICTKYDIYPVIPKYDGYSIKMY